MSQSATLSVESVYEGMDFNCTLHRVRYDQLCQGTFDKLVPLICSVISDYAIEADNVILVGGCSRIPKLQEQVIKVFPEFSVSRDFDTLNVFALGCVAEAAHLQLALKDASKFTKECEATDFVLKMRGQE